MTLPEPSADGIVHGTPAGAVAGCRGIECPNHGTELMTCRQAAQRYRGDYAYMKLVDAGTPPLTPETFARTPRPQPTRAPAAPKPAPAPRARRTEQDAAPAKPAQEKATPKRTKSPKRATVPRASAPQTPQTATVSRSKPSRPKRTRKPSEPVHGTVYGFARGCKRPEDCPKTALGEKSCAEVRHAYYADYRAKRKAGQGPPIQHGTATGYQMGCTDRSSCPAALEGGISCADASLAAERGRRRRAGIGPAHRAQHGTRGGYRQLGCRSRTECPSVLAGGISCSEASSNYQRDLRIAKRKREAEQAAAADAGSRPEWSTVMQWIDENSPELAAAARRP
jgi:hypothetical protein